MKNNISDLISIIVPVYNVESYIAKCIDSILNQTHTNLDIILINDGSTDSSGIICDNYAKKDSRIKVVHKKNGGQSKARNIGLSLAKGRYIGFVDSDDFVETTMYEKLYYYLQLNDVDIVECAVKKIYNDRIIFEESNKIFCYSGKEALKKHLSKPNDSKSPRAAVWSRLYKTSLIKEIRFPEGKIHEDYYFTYRALLKTNRYCWVDQCLYNHIYTNDTSTTQLPFSKRDIAKLDIFKERMEYLYDNGLSDLANYAEKNYYNLLLQFFYKSSYADMDQYASKIKMLIEKNRKNIFFSKVNFKKKIEYCILNISPSLYLKIRDWMMQIREK